MDSDFDTLSQFKNRQNLNKDEIYFRYDLEQNIMNAISAGHCEEVIEILDSIDEQTDFSPIVQRIPENYLRDRKNGMVIRNTFCRVAARTGGLPPVLLHLISEKYALKIEAATSANYLDNVLSTNMLKEYCQSVQNFSTLTYSDTIKEIVSYVSNHLIEPIELSEVATKFHMNAAHLSRKFKKETGFTFIDYINRHRIEYAKLLFHERNLSITDVSSRTGFNSSSYFSKVFKRQTGQSPSSYLKDKKIVDGGEL